MMLAALLRRRRRWSMRGGLRCLLGVLLRVGGGLTMTRTAWTRRGIDQFQNMFRVGKLLMRTVVLVVGRLLPTLQSALRGLLSCLRRLMQRCLRLRLPPRPLLLVGVLLR